jgi:hypothetical protein
MKQKFVGALLLLGLLITGCGAQQTFDAVTDNLQEERAYEAETGADYAPEEPGAAGKAQNAETLERMIIYNGALELTVEEPLEAQDEVARLIEGLDGYVVSSESYRFREDLFSVNMRLRVPAEAFSEAMATLRGMAIQVTRDQVSTEDVTQEYVDLEARLSALEAKAERLEELMEEAEDTEAVLAVYQELSATQADIEHVKGRMRYLERSAAMATISVVLQPDEAARPVEIAGWRPQGTAKRAVEALIRTYQFLLDAAIWFLIYILPVLLGLGLVVYGVVRLAIFLFRRTRRSRPEREEAEEA